MTLPTSSSAPLVVIGAGMAGWTTIREFRKLDTTTPVVLVTADSGDFYAKPTLSNAYAQKRGPDQLVTTPATKMAETLQVSLRHHSQVVSLDVDAKTISVRQGENAQSIAFSQLVLATGAQPVRVPLQGNGAGAVRSVNSLDDFADFYKALDVDASLPVGGAGKTVLIMGAGLIGCEFANDLAHAGVTVHVVDPSPQPLSALLPERAGAQLQKALTAIGVQWHLGRTVSAVDHVPDGRLQATLSDGRQLVADLVLSAVGLRAQTSLAAAAGLACDRGIRVNARLETSASGIYALGDCAQYESAGDRTLPYVMPVMTAARALAAGLAGSPIEAAFGLMPVSIKTPALPIVVAPAHPSVQGQWHYESDAEAVGEESGGVWRWIDAAGLQRGFALTGKSTARRMEMIKLTQL
jgi:rubredoxin-NAD+ reductase